MDRRSWPWRKKRSDQTRSGNLSSSAAVDGRARDQGDQADSKGVVEHLQISKERYASLVESEDQAKALREEVRTLKEKLSASRTDLLNKDSLVSQHAKVAEEAVSGWEKANAEASALKSQLESITLQKLTAEERATYLDGALKECMKEVRSVKEEGEQKLHNVVLEKTMQWDNKKFDLESRIRELEQRLVNASSENAEVTRTLQEYSHKLVKLRGEKSQADEEIEVLKASIQSLDKEISSLMYETQVLSKELEIRNEERDMSQRSAEIAGRQHLEDVKKIAKLEAECQRLRGLVRKKLPGAAAIAQMRQEADSLGRSRSPRPRSPSNHSTPRVGPHDFTLDNVQQCYRENELLAVRSLAMEEEIKQLREALLKRNNELQASRNFSARTATTLRQLEGQTRPPDVESSVNRNGSDPPSLTSVSEDGLDEEGSQSDYWDPSKPRLGLMDDFLEMEKLACLSSTSNGDLPLSRFLEELSSVLKLQGGNLDFGKLLEDIKSLICSKQGENASEVHHEKLKTAVSHIHDFVSILIEKLKETNGEFSEQVALDFSRCVLSRDDDLNGFIIALAAVLTDTKNTLFQSLEQEKNEGEVSGSDCVDKVTLLESKAESFENQRFSDQEEIEQLKLEKESIQAQLESSNMKIQEMEQRLAELELNLAESVKSNGLSETQLKCMAESYKSLESEILLLKEKNSSLEDDLQKEKLSHKDLEEQLERCQIAAPPLTPEADVTSKMKQEREIAAAAEKLAECQETITLLGRHLRALRAEDGPPVNEGQPTECVDFEGMASFLRRGGESPVGGFNPLFSPPRRVASGPIPRSPINIPPSNHRPSSSFSSPGRGLTKFFSKGKNLRN
ncbi:filament-like plant protein 4 [Wolffia australiana]